MHMRYKKWQIFNNVAAVCLDIQIEHNTEAEGEIAKA